MQNKGELPPKDLDALDQGLSDAGAEAPHYLGHRERLRDEFLGSPQALKDYEILELLLFYCVPRKDTKPLAKAMITRFGSLAGVLNAPAESLAETPSLPRTAPALLKVVGEAAVRMTRREILDKPILSSWERVLDYCHMTMAHAGSEQFRILFLDRKNALITDEVQQHGTVDHTPVYPREVVKRALEVGASSVLIAHNHPSGDPNPSKGDIEMTRQVRDALKVVGINLHDHVIIGKSGHCSLRAERLF